MSDPRPENCTFRLQEEGRSYPRSGCNACGRTIMTGLGRSCQHVIHDTLATLQAENTRLREALNRVPPTGTKRANVDELRKARSNFMVSDFEVADCIVEAIRGLAAAEAGVKAIRDALEPSNG